MKNATPPSVYFSILRCWKIAKRSKPICLPNEAQKVLVISILDFSRYPKTI